MFAFELVAMISAKRPSFMLTRVVSLHSKARHHEVTIAFVMNIYLSTVAYKQLRACTGEYLIILEK
jgi:hypothetical protein